MLGGGDTQRWYAHMIPIGCNQIYFNVLRSESVNTQKIFFVPTHAFVPTHTVCDIANFVDFLGGLSLYLNHLIA